MLDFTLDSKDFPPMQTTSKNILADATTTEHTNQSKQNEATNQHITPMNLDNNLATSTNPRSSNIDVAALQQMIIQNIKGEINKHIQMQIQQEMASFKSISQFSTLTSTKSMTPLLHPWHRCRPNLPPLFLSCHPQRTGVT